jgi:hypothetical protein
MTDSVLKTSHTFMRRANLLTRTAGWKLVFRYSNSSRIQLGGFYTSRFHSDQSFELLLRNQNTTEKRQRPSLPGNALAMSPPRLPLRRNEAERRIGEQRSLTVRALRFNEISVAARRKASTWLLAAASALHISTLSPARDSPASYSQSEDSAVAQELGRCQDRCRQYPSHRQVAQAGNSSPRASHS